MDISVAYVLPTQPDKTMSGLLMTWKLKSRSRLAIRSAQSTPVL